MAIDSTKPSPFPRTDRIGVGRIAFGFAAIWFLVHAAVYFGVVYCRLQYLFGANLKFFDWQAAGFFGLALFTAIRCPAAASRLLGGYLAVSTVVLLAYSRDFAMIARFALLLLWMACAIEGMRRAIARAVGRRYATYGVAAAAVYAALVPIGFLFGILYAITPSNVAALAIATALPGAVFWLRGTVPIFASSKMGDCPNSRLSENGTVPLAPADRKPWTVLECCLLQVIWLVLAIEFIGASTSQVSSDSIRVHLPYMLRVAADHGLSHQHACWHRLELMGAQTYGAMLISVGSAILAQWFSWLAVAVLALLLIEEVQRRGGSRLAGLCAGAAVLACPVLVKLAKTLSVDHIVALLCTAGFVVLFRALRPPCLRGILFSAAIVASMVQVKYTGLIFCAVWCLFLGVSLLRTLGWKTGLRWSAVAGALLLALACPWYLFVYQGTGNPFFPCLNNWFPSPHWVDGHSFQQILRSQHFQLPPGIAGVALFPWNVTYYTNSFVEGYHGAIGYAPLALAPCLLLAWRRRDVRYWDLAILELAMIAGVVLYTPYARYWIPAYPLLIAACVLAAESLVGARSWPIKKRRSLLLAGAGLIVLVSLPVPLLCLEMPWNAYAKRTSTEEHLRRTFKDYDAVQQINPILDPHDGVLCTGCSGVYLVGGRPYEFAFWWNALHGIHDRDSFADFCRRNDIRYWLVNHDSPMSTRLNGSENIVAEYWSDARRVAAAGTLALYDVASPRQDSPPIAPDVNAKGNRSHPRLGENRAVPIDASRSTQSKTGPTGGLR